MNVYQVTVEMIVDPKSRQMISGKWENTYQIAARNIGDAIEQGYELLRHSNNNVPLIPFKTTVIHYAY